MRVFTLLLATALSVGAADKPHRNVILRGNYANSQLQFSKNETGRVALHPLYRKIPRNPALVQLLGLCPLLAVTDSTVKALGLSGATLFVLVVSNTSVSLIRTVVADNIRLTVFIMIIAASVTVTDLLMQAYSYELYQILGITNLR
mgnify:CR=1 FL=1